jgi:hypothetical protein
MRIDASRQHIEAAGVDDVISVHSKSAANHRDSLTVDEHVGAVAVTGRYDLAFSNQGSHRFVSCYAWGSTT